MTRSTRPEEAPELPEDVPAEPQPMVTTQYPAGEATVYAAPDFRQVGLDRLLRASATITGLQAQITALAARVTALEQAR
jgi:hypothetical protein